MSLQSLAKNRSFVMTATLALMLVSFILILFDIEACVNIAYTIMALASSAKADAGAIGTTLTFFLGIAALGYSIFSMEFHLKHAGEPRSRNLLGISLVVQSVLALIGLVIL